MFAGYQEPSILESSDFHDHGIKNGIDFSNFREKIIEIGHSLKFAEGTALSEAWVARG